MDDGAPTLDLDFTAEIWEWRGPSPYHFVTVPPELCDIVHAVSGIVTYGWGMIPVRATIGSTTVRTAMWPKDGGYVLPLKDALRKAERLYLGDDVSVRIGIGS